MFLQEKIKIFRKKSNEIENLDKIDIGAQLRIKLEKTVKNGGLSVGFTEKSDEKTSSGFS